MFKNFLREIITNTKKFFSSLKYPQWKGFFFYIGYTLFIFLSIAPSCSFLKGILLVSAVILIWKIVAGMSWLNFCYLMLGGIEIIALAKWFNYLWSILVAVVFLGLLFGKVIINNKKSSQFLSYFISLGWILMSYGLYFYLNWQFFIAFLIYLSGLGIISFFNFLNLEKGISLNYLVYLLLNLEAYWMLHYLSFNGLQFSVIMLILQYLILNFV